MRAFIARPRLRTTREPLFDLITPAQTSSTRAHDRVTQSRIRITDRVLSSSHLHKHCLVEGVVANLPAKQRAGVAVPCGFAARHGVKVVKEQQID